MFRYISKAARGLHSKLNENKHGETMVSRSLDTNIEYLKKLFAYDKDLVIREFVINNSDRRAAAVYIDGLVNSATINKTILEPLMIESGKLADNTFKCFDEILNVLIPAGETASSGEMDKLISAFLNGDTAVFFDGIEQAIYVNTKGFEKRSITEPETENVVRGSREGFTELLRVNTALIRRKLKTQDLRMEHMQIGRRTGTQICLTYLAGIANEAMLEEVRTRLARIDTDSIINSGYIEEYIEDNPYSAFETIGYTEKPDTVASKLLEGRCAIIIDGTPFVLTIPKLFIEDFQSPEDYAVRPYIADFLRIMRLLSFILSLVAPAAYVALTTFHHELIPTSLLFTIVASSEGVPFPAFLETAIMLLTFEILKEAGLRLPKPVGQAVSIVGALVMGQAAIQAGIVGAPVVIVIAFTAISSFVAPNVTDSISILRWYLLILAALIGGYGIILGLMTILVHLASLESFGAVYMHPFSPFYATDMKDSFIRAPVWAMRTRPAALNPRDKIRRGKR